MSDPVPQVPVLARRLADALEAAGLPYAIGGALAYAEWGMARGTKDLDLNVFVGESERARALTVLRSEGVLGDEATALREFQERGVCFLHCGELRVDIFIPSIPFHDSVQHRVVRRPLLGRPAGFLTAEDLSVFKMMFFRPKDLVDVQYMLAVQQAAFDRGYVRRWLVDMVGETDERVVRWDDLCRSVPITP